MKKRVKRVLFFLSVLLSFLGDLVHPPSDAVVDFVPLMAFQVSSRWGHFVTKWRKGSKEEMSLKERV